MEAIPIRIDLLPNAWKSVGYRRTFSLELQLVSGTQPIDANDINFHAVFTTSGTKSYVAWHKDDQFKNCSINKSGKVHITFERHNLEVGEMYCELSMMWKETTATVPDVFRFATGVKLVSSGGTDPSELSIDLQLPYVNIGLNKDTMWEELRSNDESLIINISHIPTLGIDNISQLGDKLQQLSKALAGERELREENIETIQDTFKNLATINGKSLLDGGDITISGDVVEFWAVENFEDTVQDKTDKGAEDEGCLVVYSPGHNAFFLRVQSDWAVLYYKVWNGSSQWNRWLESAEGYRPRANKIYVCVSENGGLYWWDSAELVQLGVRKEELGVILEEIRRLNHELTQLIAKSESTDANVSTLNGKVTELTNNVDGLSKQVVGVEDTVINLNDKVLNLATINGKSLLDGGDITVTGDGVMIEAIPEEDIEQLGVSG